MATSAKGVNILNKLKTNKYSWKEFTYKKEFKPFMLLNCISLVSNIILHIIIILYIPKLRGFSVIIITLSIILFIIQLIKFRKYILKVYFNTQDLREIMENDSAGDYVSDLLFLLEKTRIIKEKENTYLILQKDAQLKSFQQQINPHFLYNTLDSARGLALGEKAPNTADMLEALASFFRYSISGADDLLSLNAELQGIQNYLKIQQYRTGNQLQIESDIHLDKSQLSSVKIPKLTLQPIVENAIKHGFSQKREGSVINIKIIPTQSKLNISIEDNGIGMTDEELKEVNSKFNNDEINVEDIEASHDSGIALQNINSRIKLHFGHEYGLHAYATLGQGTEIQLTIPLLENGNERNITFRKDK